MKYKYQLSPLEKLVYDILLESDKNLSYEEILSLMPEQREWNDKSVYTAMNQLKQNGLIEESGKIKVARTRAILYKATMTQDEYYAAAFQEYFIRMKHHSTNCILSALTGCRKERNQEVVNEIESWLEKEKERLRTQEEGN